MPGNITEGHMLDASSKQHAAHQPQLYAQPEWLHTVTSEQLSPSCQADKRYFFQQGALSLPCAAPQSVLT